MRDKNTRKNGDCCVLDFSLFVLFATIGSLVLRQLRFYEVCGHFDFAKHNIPLGT